jgi:sugar-specific transcriptional regulator TrmB
MDIADLQELGLAEQEAKIYLALITLGKSSASQIAAEAKVSYGTIYDVLAHMERKGLVKTLPEKTKRFIATGPEKLLEMAKEHEQHLANIKKGIVDLKKRYELEAAPPVIIAQGKANFFALESEMKEEVKREFSVRPVFVYRPVSLRKMRARIAKGTDYRILYGPHADKDVIAKYAKEKVPMKPAPIDNVALAIRDDETLIGVIKKNTTILIRDKDFADLMAWFYDAVFQKK